MKFRAYLVQGALFGHETGWVRDMAFDGEDSSN